MRNLKASPRVPFPQLPFSFGDKPVRQTTRRWRWGAGGGRPGRVAWACRSVAGHALPVPLPPGGVAERPCLWKPPDARAAGDPLVRRPRPSLPPTAPAPYAPRQPQNRPPHESSRRGASVSRLSPGPGHSTRSRGSSWRAGGLGGAPASSSPTRRARRAPSTPHVGCFRRAPRSLGPDAPMGRGPTGARGGSRARPSAGFVPPARDGPPPLTGNTLGACPRGRHTLRRRASPAGRAGSPGESRLTPGAGRPVSALPGSPPSSATFAVQDATARGT